MASKEFHCVMCGTYFGGIVSNTHTPTDVVCNECKKYRRAGAVQAEEAFISIKRRREVHNIRSVRKRR